MEPSWASFAPLRRFPICLRTCLARVGGTFIGVVSGAIGSHGVSRRAARSWTVAGGQPGLGHRPPLGSTTGYAITPRSRFWNKMMQSLLPIAGKAFPMRYLVCRSSAIYRAAWRMLRAGHTFSRKTSAGNRTGAETETNLKTS